MIKEIKALEKESSALEPDADKQQDLTQQITHYVTTFLKNLPKKKAYEADDAPSKSISQFFPAEEGHSPEKLMKIIDAALVKPGINMASGGFLGYIPGGGLYLSALADYLGAATNKYASIYYSSPGAIRMENMLIRWMCDLVGYDDKSFGHLSSGGSMANLSAVVAARDAKKMLQAPESNVIYFTHQVHHCLLKAIHITGLSSCCLHLIPMKDNLEMDVNALEELIISDKKKGLKPKLVVASAGTTDVGAVDNLNAIADIAEKYGMWYHVDGAYGGFFLLTDHGKKKMRGICRADSIVMDPHKGLFLPYGCGALLLKEGNNLLKSFHVEANYLQDTKLGQDKLSNFDEVSPADISPELSRHFRGLRIWLPLQLYGIKPFRAALEEKILLTRYFHKEIQKAGFETGVDPELSITIFRYVPSELKNDPDKVNQYNHQLMEAVQEEGRVFIASTNIAGVNWLRLAVLSFRTHLEHIQMLLSFLKAYTNKTVPEATA